MKHSCTAALTLLMAVAQLGGQEVPRAGEFQQCPNCKPQYRVPYGPRQDDGLPRKPHDHLPANLVPFPAKYRVKNCTDDYGEGCCGWVSMKALLLQAGYEKEAESLDVRRGGVMDNGLRSQLDDWLTENSVPFEVVHCGTPHNWKFLESHLPCLVMFNCADSDYGYCEEDAEGWFDKRHRKPWIRPRGRRDSGHVAVIAGVDETSIYMVANRPSNYSEENYQQIDRQDFDSRWYGYCLCLRKRHKQPPQVQPPKPDLPVPQSPPEPAPAPTPPNIVIQISQVLDAKLDPLVKRIEILERKQQVLEEKIIVTYSPPAK